MGTDVSQNGAKRSGLSRWTVARGVKREVERLREHLDASYKLTNAELAVLQRVALANILAERTMRRALQGKCAVTDATRAASVAIRTRKDLSKLVLPRDELMARLGRSA